MYESKAPYYIAHNPGNKPNPKRREVNCSSTRISVLQQKPHKRMRQKYRKEKRREVQPTIKSRKRPNSKPTGTPSTKFIKTLQIILRLKYNGINTWNTSNAWNKLIGKTRYIYWMTTQNIAPKLWKCYLDLNPGEMTICRKLWHLNIRSSYRQEMHGQ